MKTHMICQQKAAQSRAAMRTYKQQQRTDALWLLAVLMAFLTLLIVMWLSVK